MKPVFITLRMSLGEEISINCNNINTIVDKSTPGNTKSYIWSVGEGADDYTCVAHSHDEVLEAIDNAMQTSKLTKERVQSLVEVIKEVSQAVADAKNYSGDGIFEAVQLSRVEEAAVTTLMETFNE